MSHEQDHHLKIFVNHIEHDVHNHDLTGAEIKTVAGVPDDHVLCLDVAEKQEHEHDNYQAELQVIDDCDRVHIKNGMHFFTHARTSQPVTVTIDRREYVFEHAKQTGKSIKERAGIPLTDVLFLQEPKEDRVITDDECIILKCGDCFHSAPPANYGHANADPFPDGFGDGRVVPQSNGWRFVVFDNYALPDGFSAKSVRLLIKLAPNFPDAAPDMFWVHPELRTSSNTVPQGTSLESLMGEQWQRYSWHLQPGAWKVGTSTLRDFMRCVRARFEKRN